MSVRVRFGALQRRLFAVHPIGAELEQTSQYTNYQEQHG